MIELKKLPYSKQALEPYISKETVAIHHDKHQGGYVKTVNELIQDTSMVQLDLRNLILTVAADTFFKKIFNNAAQIWNHQFYWKSLTPDKKKQKISPELKFAVERDFGSIDECIEQLISMGTSHFGSGWVWLVVEGNILKILTTSNADTPLTQQGVKPLLCLDVWEHAYYLDYKNLRKDYLKQVATNLLNWNFASKNFQEVK